MGIRDPGQSLLTGSRGGLSGLAPMRTRVVRVNESLWAAARARAASEAESLGAVIRRALLVYIEADTAAAPVTLVSLPDQLMVPRSFRLPGDLCEAAVAAAKHRGDALSEVIRRALAQYVRETRIS